MHGSSTRPRWGANLAHEAIDRHVLEGHGADEAFRFIDKHEAASSLSYGELAERTDRMAGALRALGLEPGERVFLLAGRIPELYIAALGALKARAVVCPLFSAFGPEPIRQRMVLGDATVLVTTTSLYRRKVAPIRDEVPTLRHVLLADAPPTDDASQLPEGCHSLHELLADAAPLPAEVTDAEEPALLHFTSGTTGAPKGALHVHAAGAAHRDSAAYVFGLQAGEVYWCTADPGWVTGTSYGIVGPLGCRATLIVDEAEFDAERWYRILEQHRVAVWYTAPTAIRMLMRAGAELARSADLSRLRFAASVGEPLDPGAVVWGRDVLGRPFHDSWWQSETGSIMIAASPEVEVRPGSMGKPVPWVTVGLLAADDEGTPVLDGEGRPTLLEEPDVPGALAIRAGWTSMFRTYLGAPDRYAACFLDGWYLTGDLARRDADGYYWFVGRADDVIKTAGHLIGPFEVEKALVEHPDVTAAGVYGVPDEVAGAVVHARIVLRPGADDSEELRRSVMAHARKRLGPAVAPRDIGVVDTLPFTRSGKIMRRLLRARELGLPEGDLSTLETGPESPDAPTGATQEVSGD